MNLFYRHKHRKPSAKVLKFYRKKRKLKKSISWHLDILRLDLFILWCDIFICKDFLKDKSIQLIDFHDEWWDRVDYKLESYLHGARSYLLREYVLWKRYFRSIHEGLD